MALQIARSTSDAARADSRSPRAAATVGALARWVEPLWADTACELAAASFSRDAELFAIPVVDRTGTPVGVVNRLRFFERFATGSGGDIMVHQPVSSVVHHTPIVVDEGSDIAELGSTLSAAPHQSIVDGFIVTRGGVYTGVATGIDLIRAFAARRESDLHRMAHHDPLTGLPNRQMFEQRLADTLAQDGERSRVAVLSVNLDRFKDINDTYGHRFGDLVLCGMAHRLRGALRKTDIVARLSGDEFGIILVGSASAASAEGVARVLVARCAAWLDVDGREVGVSCSIGLAVYPDDATTREQLSRAADAAQCCAKQIRNTWQRYTKEMETGRSWMPNPGMLRAAIENKELHVFYQPIACLNTGRIVGVEALVRWTHPVQGPLPPLEIVRLAEGSGLIVPLSEFVVRTAMQQMLEWDRETGRSDLTLAVNISPVQIHEGGLVAMLDRLAAETGFAPTRLELELTEGTAMRAAGPALQTLQTLKLRGYTLAIDDFGIGYSALSRLDCLPIDAMKIDRAFVHGIDAEGRGGVIARAIIAMGRSLGLRLVGEGVETQEQLSFLKAEGCDYVQGYLFAHPMAAADVASLLVQNSLFGPSPATV